MSEEHVHNVDAEPPKPLGAGAADPRRFGRRLRQLRIERGLSQTDLAGPGISASYVSLLESGKRMPTGRVIEQLADRLGCPPEFLRSGVDAAVAERVALAVRYADLALHNGEPAEALAESERALAGPAVDAELRWRARRIRAAALESLGRLEEALPELEALRAEAGEQRRWEEHVRVTIDLVRCYKEMGDVSYAVELGEQALAQVDRIGLTASDAHAQLAATLVGLYYERGDLTRAEVLAGSTLQAIEPTGSARARGSVYWNASLTAEGRGDLPRAMVLAQRALALFAESDDQRALARLRVAFAWLLLRSSPPRAEEARGLLEQSRQALQETGSSVDLAYCDTELARCDLLLGRPAEAAERSRSALRHLGDGPRLESAHARLVLARALLAQDRRDEAVAAFRAAAESLGALGVSRQAAAAWRELADAFAHLGLLADAALAYQQALSDAGIRPAPDVSYAETGQVHTPPA